MRWLDELLPDETEPAAIAWAYFVRGFLAVLQNDPAAARPVLDGGFGARLTAGGRDTALRPSSPIPRRVEF